MSSRRDEQGESPADDLNRSCVGMRPRISNADLIYTCYVTIKWFCYSVVINDPICQLCFSSKGEEPKMAFVPLC